MQSVSVMGVVPSPRNGIGRSFFEKREPSFVPGIEGSGKVLLIRCAEHCGELFEFNAGNQFGVVCEIPGNDLLLMEMANLDGDITEDLFHTRPAV